MTPDEIETELVTLVAHADSAAVRGGFGVLAGRVSAGQEFLDVKNRFRRVPLSGGQARRRKDAPPFFAAAAIYHIEDGWSYLGRSFAALLRGDYGAATHFSYYAELRAALALMASEGLLNIHTRVYALDEQGVLMECNLQRGTHELAWGLLDAWSRPTHALSVLGDVLEPFGMPFAAWMDAAKIPAVGGASPAATAASWMGAWALDLKTFKEDRESRNQFSYNPTALCSRAPVNADEFACESWSLLEPRFATLDRHLLRAAITGMIGQPAVKATTRKKRLDAYIAEIARIGGPPQAGWDEFLRADGSVGLIAHSRVKPSLDRQQPCCTMSRAACLLRVSSGAVKRQMMLATTQPLLEAWAERVVDERALAHIADIDGFEDLWGDIDAALTRFSEGDFEAFEQEALRRTLETCERVAVWSLAA